MKTKNSVQASRNIVAQLNSPFRVW